MASASSDTQVRQAGQLGAPVDGDWARRASVAGGPAGPPEPAGIGQRGAGRRCRLRGASRSRSAATGSFWTHGRPAGRDRPDCSDVQPPTVPSRSPRPPTTRWPRGLAEEAGAPAAGPAGGAPAPRGLGHAGAGGRSPGPRAARSRRLAEERPDDAVLSEEGRDHGPSGSARPARGSSTPSTAPASSASRPRVDWAATSPWSPAATRSPGPSPSSGPGHDPLHGHPSPPPRPSAEPAPGHREPQPPPGGRPGHRRRPRRRAGRDGLGRSRVAAVVQGVADVYPHAGASTSGTAAPRSPWPRPPGSTRRGSTVPRSATTSPTPGSPTCWVCPPPPSTRSSPSPWTAFYCTQLGW